MAAGKRLTGVVLACFFLMLVGCRAQPNAVDAKHTYSYRTAASTHKLTHYRPLDHSYQSSTFSRSLAIVWPRKSGCASLPLLG